MPNDIFSSNVPKFGDAFAADETTLTFDVGDGSNGGLGALVQNFQANYQRPVQRIFELGKNKKTYYIIGRAEGQATIQKLAAPSPIGHSFIEKFADPCQVSSNNMAVAATPGYECDNSQVAGRWEFRNCLIQSLQFQVDVQAIALTEGVQLAFASMNRVGEK